MPWKEPESDGPEPSDWLESKIEAKAVKEARKGGWLAFKMGGLANSRGLPDRLFTKRGLYIWIEFKRPGERPTAKQLIRHKQLRDNGAIVYVCDRWIEAIELLGRAETSGQNWYPGAEDL